MKLTRSEAAQMVQPFFSSPHVIKVRVRYSDTTELARSCSWIVCWVADRLCCCCCLLAGLFVVATDCGCYWAACR